MNAIAALNFRLLPPLKMFNERKKSIVHQQSIHLHMFAFTNSNKWSHFNLLSSAKDKVLLLTLRQCNKLHLDTDENVFDSKIFMINRTRNSRSIT